MKMKYLKLLVLICLPFLMLSCDKREQLEKKYMEACAEGDYEKARAAVLELEAEDKWAANDGMKYVNDKEIYSLLAKPSRDNDSRIMYIYNTYERSQLPDMADVVEVAISMGNENLPEKLIKAGVEPNAAIIKGAVDAENCELIDLIIKKRPVLIFETEVMAYYEAEYGVNQLNNLMTQVYNDLSDQTNRSDFYKIPKKATIKNAIKYDNTKLVEQLVNDSPDLILDDEVSDYYKSKVGENKLKARIAEIVTESPKSALKDPNVQKFLKLYPTINNIIAEHLCTKINEIKKTAPTFHSQGIVKFYDGKIYAEGGYGGAHKDKQKMPSENKAIKEYNSKLKEVYGDALTIGRKDIALRAVNAMKPIIEWYEGNSGDNIKGYVFTNNDQGLIYHNYDEIDKLKADLK